MGCSESNDGDSSHNIIQNDGNSSNNGIEDDKVSLTLKSIYELPYVFGAINQNVILDEDSIIFVGGNKAEPNGAQHDGHPAFSNIAIKIDLISGVKETLDINASTGHPFGSTIANGRGNSAKIYKLDTNRYLVYGGFQYVKNMEILDFSQGQVTNIDSNFQIVDTEYGGLNSTTYYANDQASAISENNNIFFFGFNSGLYPMNTIIMFNYNDENLMIVDTNLTMGRHNATAEKLVDGRIIVVGGWDGSGAVTLGSATRRVEIFNPNDNSIIRVTDYPTPIHNGQRIEKAFVENDSICIGNYQYIVSQDNWEIGCSINIDLESFDNTKYNFPNHNTIVGNYIKTLSNGDIVYMEAGNYSSTFSDTLLGYPVDKPTKIYVYSQSN